jgi:acyl carrier protein
MSLEVVQAVFAEVLGLEGEVDWSGIRYQQVVGWDSVGHMTLVGELEERFNIMFDTDAIINMSSFDRALDILRDYGVTDLAPEG